MPLSRRKLSAAASPAWPTRSLSGRIGGRAAGAWRWPLAIARLRRFGLLLGLGHAGSRLGRVGQRRSVLGLGQLGLADLLELGVDVVDLAGSVGNLGGAGARHLRPADGLATLADAGALAHLLAQVVELGAAHVTVAQHL